MTQLEEAPFVPEHGEHLGHLPNGTDLVPNHLFPSSRCIGCGRKEKIKQSQYNQRLKTPRNFSFLTEIMCIVLAGVLRVTNLKKRHYSLFLQSIFFPSTSYFFTHIVTLYKVFSVNSYIHQHKSQRNTASVILNNIVKE